VYGVHESVDVLRHPRNYCDIIIIIIKVIKNDTVCLGTYDFLLVIHSNHEPICTIYSDFGHKCKFFLAPLPHIKRPVECLTSEVCNTGWAQILE